jgi:hypothetical protein
MKQLLLGPLGLALLVSSGSAYGEEPTVTRAPTELMAKERRTVRSFYGWEILATGEVGGALTALSVWLPAQPVGSTLSTAGFVIGAPVFAMGGPLVHWSHGDFDKGLISIAMNLALPITFGLVGSQVLCHGDSPPDDCGFVGFFRGLGTATALVPLVDAFALGWEHIPVDDELARSPARLRLAREGWSVAPVWGAPRGGFTLGVGGTF